MNIPDSRQPWSPTQQPRGFLATMTFVLEVRGPAPAVNPDGSPPGCPSAPSLPVISLDVAM